MKIRNVLAAMAWFAIAMLCSAPASAQRSAGGGPPADPWPRVVELANGQVLVYQPQVNSWVGNQLDFRAALAIKPDGAKEESFGVVFATARTAGRPRAAHGGLRGPEASRRSTSRRLPDRGAAYARELQTQLATAGAHDLARPARGLAGAGRRQAADASRCRTIRRRSSSATRRRSWCRSTARRCSSRCPTTSRFQRVINTRALILQGGLGRQLLPARLRRLARQPSALDGPWTQSQRAADRHGRRGRSSWSPSPAPVDLLDGGPNANPKPSLANGVPTIYTSQVPTELIVFKGQPELRADRRHAAAVGRQHQHRRVHRHHQQQLLRADGRAAGSAPPALTGPWSFVAEQRAAGRLRAHPAAVAGRRGAADGGRHAAGAGSGDRELDPADGDGAAEERAELHAELRRPAAVRADRRHAAVATSSTRRCR